MSHKTFKVSIVIDELVENFYIKHYVDDFQPVFNKFKTLVFQRNPMVSSPNLKIYWIDAENDKILISCEEDFRLYTEQGAGKKIFFSVSNGKGQQQEEDYEIAMDAEESNERQKPECRNSKRIARDEEKQKRVAKRLAEKMQKIEEKVRQKEERRSEHLSSEKHERKHAEKLERAKRRCEQIRQIIGASIGSIDPANLNGSAPYSANSSAPPTTTASVQTMLDPVLNPSPDTIRLLSSAIAGCLQPCNLINKILNDIIGMVPQPISESAAQPSAQSPNSNDQQQQTEFPRQNSATNTSDVNTPVSAHPSSQEIEALFKEAAKELEKMNEIVNNSKSMETSSGSIASSFDAATQAMLNMAASTSTMASGESEATVINLNAVNDVVDSDTRSPPIEDDYKIVTPPKSMRSRESSIEVHDVNSMMSDDSRDWTMLDAATHDVDDETSIEQTFEDSFKSISTETQTAESLAPVAGPSKMTDEEIRATIQKSLDAVGEVTQVVKNSIAVAQESLKSVQQQPIANMQPVVQMERIDQYMKEQVEAVQASKLTRPEVTFAPVASAPVAVNSSANLIKAETRQEPVAPAPSAPIPTIFIPLGTLSATTQANLAASRITGAKKKTSAAPAPVVYHENPKINTAVHQMMFMGFSNEGEWLTQLLINVDGDVAKAINFLTPQPKNKPQ